MENKIKIVEMDLNMDVEEISAWDEKFWNQPVYQGIQTFILMDSRMSLRTIFNCIKSSKNTNRYCFTIKDNSDKIIGFIVSCLRTKRGKRILEIDFLALHPNFEHKGYGEQVLKGFFQIIATQFQEMPNEIQAEVARNNYSCLRLFKKFGFTFSDVMSDFYYIVTAPASTLLKQTEQNEEIKF